MSTSNSISGQRIRARKMLTLAAGAGLVFAALPAASYAADVNWNVADGNWDADASWLGGVKPTAADRAVLNNATAGSTARVTTLVTSSPTTTHEGVTGVVVTASNILSIEAGGEILTGTVGADLADATFGIHIGDGGVGSATVTGNGRLVAQGNNIGGSLFIGQAGGTGALTVNHADARAEGNDVMIGGANIGGTASPGTATLTLSAGTVQARAWSFVGRDGGTGTLDFTGGTFLTGGQHHVGRGTNGLGVASIGVVNHSAGSHTAGHQAHVGIDGGNGTYNISGTATFTAGNDIAVGNGSGSIGHVEQTGGTFQSTGGWNFIGRTSGTGTYNISGGTFHSPGQLNVGFEGGNGTLNVSSAGNVTIGEEMTVGRDSGSVGLVEQTGGTLTSNRFIHVGRGGGSGTYKLSGGTLTSGVLGQPDPDLVVGADNGTNGVLEQTGGNLNVARWGFVGRAGNSGGGTGTVNHSGGTYSSGGWLRIAENPGAVGAYNLTGTAVANIGGQFGDTDAGDNDVIVGVGSFSDGTLKVADTATLNAARDIAIGMDGGTGRVNQQGGDVNVAGAIFAGHSRSSGDFAPTATYNLSGGTLDVNLDINLARVGTVTPTDPLTPTAVMNVSGGTATVNGSVVVGLNGHAVMNQSGGTVNAGGVIVARNTGSSGVYSLTGGALSALSMVNNGTFDFSGGTASVGSINGTGTTTVGAGRSLTLDQLRQNSVVVNGLVTINPEGGSSGTTIVKSITVNDRLDQTNNDMIVDYEAGSSPEFALRDKVLLARDGDVQGIFFTGSDDDFSDKILAFGEAAELGFTEFNTFTVDDTAVLGKYTYYGDANFDGAVTTDDYVAVDLGLGTGDSWVQGDFDLNGVVTTDDYVVVDLNLGKGSLDPLAFAEERAAMIALHTEMFGQSYVEKLAYASEHGWVAASVPEPAVMSLLGLGAAGLLARRRRR